MAQNGDYIDSLPKDKKSSEYDQQKPIMDTVFGENETLVSRAMRELSNAILIAVLFILFTLQQVDSMIHKNIPNSNNMFVMYGVKCSAIIILYYLFRNVQLVRKN